MSITASYKRYWEPSFLEMNGLAVGAGFLSTVVSYPMSFLKTVIQHRNEAIGMRGINGLQLGTSAGKIMREMHSHGGGFSQFYTGFSAHFSGRLVYLLARNNIYKAIYDQVKPIKPFNDLTVREKMWIAGFAGAIGAILSNPFEVVAIRQVLDTQIRPDWRRNYRGVKDGLEQLALEGNLFKGVNVNIWRHVVLNISMTYPYDFVQERLWIIFGDYGFVQPLSLAIAAGVGAVFSLPFDNLRTKIMQQHADPSRNRLQYRTATQLFSEMMRVEGSKFSPWVGFYSHYLSVLTTAALTLYSTDYVTSIWKKDLGLEDWQI